MLRDRIKVNNLMSMLFFSGGCNANPQGVGWETPSQVSVFVGRISGRTEEIGSLVISLPEASKDPALEPLGVTDVAKSQAQEALLPLFPSPSPQETQLSVRQLCYPIPGPEQPTALWTVSVISLGEGDESTGPQRPSGLQSENGFRKNKAKRSNVTKNYLFIAFGLFKGF